MMAKQSRHEAAIRRELAEAVIEEEMARKALFVAVGKRALLERLIDAPDDDDKGGDNGEE